MRSLTFTFVATILYLAGFSQPPSIFPVVLKNVLGTAPFYPSQTRTQLSDTPGFTGIPDTLKAYKIKELNLSTTKEKLFVLYGITKQGKRLIQFDADFNKDFSGEQVFIIEYDNRYERSREKTVLDSIHDVEVKFPNAPSLFVKPNIYNCCFTYKDLFETA